MGYLEVCCFQVFGCSSSYLSVTDFQVHCNMVREHTLYNLNSFIIANILNWLRFVLCCRIWFIMVNVPCAPKEIVYWVECSINQLDSVG